MGCQDFLGAGAGLARAPWVADVQVRRRVSAVLDGGSSLRLARSVLPIASTTSRLGPGFIDRLGTASTPRGLGAPNRVTQRRTLIGEQQSSHAGVLKPARGLRLGLTKVNACESPVLRAAGPPRGRQGWALRLSLCGTKRAGWALACTQGLSEECPNSRSDDLSRPGDEQRPRPGAGRAGPARLPPPLCPGTRPPPGPSLR